VKFQSLCASKLSGSLFILKRRRHSCFFLHKDTNHTAND